MYFVRFLSFILLAYHLKPVKSASYDENYLNSVKLYNEGVKCAREGDLLCAIDNYTKALAINSKFPQALQNLGLVYEQYGNFKEAIECHKKAINLAPDNTFKCGTITNLASTLIAQNGIANIDTVLSIGRLLEPVIEIGGDCAKDESVWFLLGKTYFDAQMYEKAERIFQSLLKINPNNFKAILNIGNHHFINKRYNEAESFLRKALHIASKDPNLDPKDPTMMMIASNLAQSLRLLGRYNEGIQVFRHLLPHDLSQTDLPKPLTSSSSNDMINKVGNPPNRKKTSMELSNLTLFNNIFALMCIACSWKDFEEIEHALNAIQHIIPSQTLGQLLPSGIVDPHTLSLTRTTKQKLDIKAAVEACEVPISHFHIAQQAMRRIDEEDAKSNNMNHKNDKILRIGYLSYDWRDHPMGRLTRRLVTSHSEARGFNSTCFSYGPNDGSDTRVMVETNINSKFVDIAAMGLTNDAEAAHVVASTGLHILIDLTTHTFEGRIGIAARGPAPIVINFLGWPGSTGCKGFDYAMVDARAAPPETTSHSFTEKLLYLPRSYQTNDLPNLEVSLDEETMLSNRNMLLDSVDWEQQENLRARARPLQLICSFNSHKKIEPRAISVWTAILNRLPNALLILMNEKHDVRMNLASLFKLHGISTKRVLYAQKRDWHDHLQRLAGCDLAVDTFTYGAHTTAADALWMGVPLVVLESASYHRMPSRVAASIGTNLFGGILQTRMQGLEVADVLIVQSMMEYEDTVVRLLKSNRMTLLQIRSHIATAARKMMAVDKDSVQNDIERGYQLVWDVYKSSLSQNNADSVVGKKLSASHHVIVGSSSASPTTTTTTTTATTNANTAATTNSPPISIALKKLMKDVTTAQSDNDCMTVETIVRESCKLDLLHCNHNWNSPSSANTIKILELLSTYMPMDFRKQGTYPLYELNELNFNTNTNTNTNVTDYRDAARDAAIMLSSYGGCLIEAVEINCSVLLGVLASALAFRPDLLSLRNLGLGLESCGYVENGYAAAATALQTEQSEMLESHRLKLSPSVREELRKWEYGNDDDDDAIRIVFFCREYGNEWWPNWGPSAFSKGQGMGGSEEAVLYTSRELSRRGYQVAVFADPSESDMGLDEAGVLWLPWGTFDHRLSHSLSSSPHGHRMIFIAWRYAKSIVLSIGSDKVLLWLHDLVGSEITAPVLKALEEKNGRILVQSSFHRMQLSTTSIPTVEKYTTIMPNGIDDRYTNANFYAQCGSKRQVFKFIYASAPERGLETVLISWPEIRAVLPTATLYVFYGFTPSVKLQMTNTLGAIVFDHWYNHMQRLLQQEGIVYIGAVSHDRLREELCSSDLILYPTTYPETGCITIMKAMAAGTLPVTSRYEHSVLSDLTSVYDGGPLPLQNRHILNRNFKDLLSYDVKNTSKVPESYRQEWVKAVVGRATLQPQQKLDLRKKMQQYIKHKHTWKLSTNTMETLFL